MFTGMFSFPDLKVRPTATIKPAFNSYDPLLSSRFSSRYGFTTAESVHSFSRCQLFSFIIITISLGYQAERWAECYFPSVFIIPEAIHYSKTRNKNILVKA